ncbi:hypothetical protein DFH29DRAFT_1056780 [Suillus ampliporus]|nr:hypothetical protein DFH29DRAFT_1056780 [Suillus ampliporus]
MDDRDDDKLSSSLPETLHAHIIRPDDPDGRSDEASSSAQDRHPSQRQASRLTSQFISSLTPATFPNNHGSRETLSHDRVVSPDIEESGYSTQRVPRTSAGRRRGAAAGFAHPPRAFLIPGSSEQTFYHRHPHHSYTYPPPLPNPYPVPLPSTYREEDDDEDFESTYETAPLGSAQGTQSDRYLTSQPRPVPGPVAPFFPGDVIRSREHSPYLYGTPHSYDDSRYLQPPSHHLESNIIRHHSLPSQRWDERSRSGSSSSRHTPGTLLDDRPIQRASSYSLPPFNTLLRPLRQEYRGLQSSLPGLDDQTHNILPAEGSVEERESSNGTPTDFSARGYRRGKRRRSDSQDERKTKVARKIYVACDFCRGRKLRCDGSKPSCANCSTRTLDCKYEDHPRRRGPGKAPKGSRNKKSEAKSRKGRKNSRAATSEVDKEGSEQPSAAALPNRHVFEPPMMLPGHGHLHLSELEAVYAPPRYTDRPSASNVDREGPDPIPQYRFTSGVFDQGPVEGMRPPWGREEEDGRLLRIVEIGYLFIVATLFSCALSLIPSGTTGP